MNKAIVTSFSAAMLTSLAGIADIPPTDIWFVPTQVLQPDPAYWPARFGWQIGISGDRAVIVAAGKWDSYYGEPDFVYLYSRSDGVWTKVQQLDAGVPDTRFGAALAMTSTRVAISATRDGGGKVFVYDLLPTGLVLSATIDSPATDNGEEFGTAIALEGNTLIATAIFHDEPGIQNCGAAYVFEFANEAWTFTAKLEPAQPIAAEFFGDAVALDQGSAFVASSRSDRYGPDAGAVWTFQKQGGNWTPIGTKWTGRMEDRFGAAMAARNGVIAISAPSSAGDPLFDPRVHVFYNTGGVLQPVATLTDPWAQCLCNTNFGHAVATDGETIVVSSPTLLTSMGAEPGVVYTYTKDLDDWMLKQMYPQEPLQPHWYFGDRVAVDGNTILVADPDDQSNGRSSGAVHVLRRPVQGCPGDLNLDALVDDADFVKFCEAFNATTVPPADPRADFNGDGFVDDADFSVFASKYDELFCP